MERRVRVSGSGTVTVAADAVRMQVGVSVTRPSPAEALREATGAYEGMLAVLAEAGVPAERRSTTGVQVQREWDHEGRQPSRHTASITLAVQLAGTETAGALAERLIEAGGEGAALHGLTPVVEDRGAAETAARAAAYADARTRAEQYAALAGAALGPVVEVTEGRDVVWQEQSGGMNLALAAHHGGGPTVEGGGLAVTVGITASWEIVAG